MTTAQDLGSRHAAEARLWLRLIPYSDDARPLVHCRGSGMRRSRAHRLALVNRHCAQISKDFSMLIALSDIKLFDLSPQATSNKDLDISMRANQGHACDL